MLPQILGAGILARYMTPPGWCTAQAIRPQTIGNVTGDLLVQDKDVGDATCAESAQRSHRAHARRRAEGHGCFSICDQVGAILEGAVDPDR